MKTPKELVDEMQGMVNMHPRCFWVFTMQDAVDMIKSEILKQTDQVEKEGLEQWT